MTVGSPHMNATSSRLHRWQILAVAAVLTGAALFAYWPALTGGFVWDDDTLLTESKLVKAPDGPYRMWFTTEPLDYWPLTNSSFWLEWRLWGMRSTGYHVTNLLLHVASGLLVWAILRRLAIPGAPLAAAIFVLHPVNVESVAWIAQRKNTLSMLFFLLSILWYLRIDPDPQTALPAPAESEPRARGRRRTAPAPAPRSRINHWYWLSLLAFVLAMLSKGSVAILPGVLLLIAWWRRGAIVRTDLVRIGPFFVVAVALTLLNIWFQSHLMTGAIRDATLVQRLLGAGAIVWFYLYKAVVPIRLVFVYPQWDVRSDDFRWWLPAAAAVATTVVLIWQRHRPVVRALLFGWLFFCLGLLPVMGLTDVYYMRYSLVADHYQYIAILGVVACVAAGVARLVTLAGEPLLNDAAWPVALLKTLPHYLGFSPPVAVRVWCGVLLLMLGVGSHVESRQYTDADTLYRATLRKNPSSWLMHNLLGVRLVDTSIDEAIAHFREAVRLNPGLLEAHNNLCQAAQHVGRPDEAIAECSKALHINPNTPTAHNGLGLALLSRGRREEARAEFESALRLDESYAEAHNNLANVLVSTGDESEAVQHYRQALAITPGFVDARRNLGLALDRLGKRDEAIEQYREALRLDPSLAEVRARLDTLLQRAGVTDTVARYRTDLRLHPDQISLHASLGEALLEAGRAAEAVDEYTIALSRLPDVPSVHFGLANALQEAGRGADAETHFRDAIRLKPDFAEAHRHLGDLLLERGRLEEAVTHYKDALSMDPKAAEAHNNLGVALVRLGRPDQAIEHFKAALAIDPEYTDARNNLEKTLNAR
jgi:tetratricopeptide (TPR) repeat protein